MQILASVGLDNSPEESGLVPTAVEGFIIKKMEQSPAVRLANSIYPIDY